MIQRIVLFTLVVSCTLCHAQDIDVESAKLNVVDAPTLGRGEVELEFGYHFVHGSNITANSQYMKHRADDGGGCVWSSGRTGRLGRGVLV